MWNTWPNYKKKKFWSKPLELFLKDKEDAYPKCLEVTLMDIMKAGTVEKIPENVIFESINDEKTEIELQFITRPTRKDILEGIGWGKKTLGVFASKNNKNFLPSAVLWKNIDGKISIKLIGKVSKDIYVSG